MMRVFIYIFLGLFTASANASSTLEVLSGHWHWFAAKRSDKAASCSKNINVQYTKLKTDEYALHLRCQTLGGRRVSKHWRVRPAIGASNPAALELATSYFFGKYDWSEARPHWLLALNEHEGIAIVGDPSQSYAWVLTRKQKPSVAALDWATSEARSLGFNPCHIRRPNSTTKLCDL